MNNHQAQANDQAEAPGPGQQAETPFLQDFLTALAFLSRLPITTSGSFSLANASRAFGVVGLFLGALTGLVFWLAGTLGLATLPAVILALVFSTLLTGGLHEDGLADVADGFGGGWSKDRKLEIMRDSAIGTYGVLALIFSVGLRVTSYSLLLGNQQDLLLSVGLFASIACLSRASMAVLMYQLPLARNDGRAAQAGNPGHNNLRQGLLISVISSAVFLTLGFGLVAMLVCVAGAVVAYLVIKQTALSQIDGYTGDVLGSLQQITEICALIVIMIVV